MHREWLKGKLTENTTNKQTLNQQFQSLIQSLTELELAEALSVSDELIAKRIKDIRNSLTHVGRKYKDIRSEEIIWLSYLMEYLLKALLLREIGFPAERVKKDRQYSFRMEQIEEALSHLRQSEK